MSKNIFDIIQTGYLEIVKLPKTIEGRLTAIILFVCSISIIFTASFLTLLHLKDIKQNFEDDLSITAKVITESLAASIAFNDTKRSEELLLALGENQNILRACLYNENNLLINSYISHASGTVKCDNSLASDRNSSSSEISVILPVAQKDLALGKLYILADTENFYAVALKQVLTVSIILFLVFIAISIPMARKLQKNISKPLHAITDSSRQLTARNDTLALIVGNETDEIRYLENVFGAVQTYLEKIHSGKIIDPDTYTSVTTNQDLLMQYLSTETERSYLAQRVAEELTKNKKLGEINESYFRALDINLSLADKLRTDVESFSDLLKMEKNSLEEQKTYQDLSLLIKNAFLETHSEKEENLVFLNESEWGFWPVYTDPFYLFCKSVFSLCSKLFVKHPHKYMVSFERVSSDRLVGVICFECVLDDLSVNVIESIQDDAEQIEDDLFTAKFTNNINAPNLSDSLEMLLEKHSLKIRSVLPSG